MARKKKSLNGYRAEIDSNDRRIVCLLNRRASVAVEIGRIKRKSKCPVRDPRREKEVIKRAGRINMGPMTAKGMETVYKRIVASCTEVQRRLM